MNIRKYLDRVWVCVWMCARYCTPANRASQKATQLNSHSPLYVIREYLSKQHQITIMLIHLVCKLRLWVSFTHIHTDSHTRWLASLWARWIFDNLLLTHVSISMPIFRGWNQNSWWDELIQLCDSASICIHLCYSICLWKCLPIWFSCLCMCVCSTCELSG